MLPSLLPASSSVNTDDSTQWFPHKPPARLPVFLLSHFVRSHGVFPLESFSYRWCLSQQPNLSVTLPYLSPSSFPLPNHVLSTRRRGLGSGVLSELGFGSADHKQVMAHPVRSSSPKPCRCALTVPERPCASAGGAQGGTQEVVVSGQATWEVKPQMVVASGRRELRWWWKKVGKSWLFEFNILWEANELRKK